jgi:hypothetical protein
LREKIIKRIFKRVIRFIFNPTPEDLLEKIEEKKGYYPEFFKEKSGKLDGGSDDDLDNNDHDNGDESTKSSMHKNFKEGYEKSQNYDIERRGDLLRETSSTQDSTVITSQNMKITETSLNAKHESLGDREVPVIIIKDSTMRNL